MIQTKKKDEIKSKRPNRIKRFDKSFKKGGITTGICRNISQKHLIHNFIAKVFR